MRLSRPILLLALLALVLALLAPAVDAACTCKDAHQAVGPCNTKIHVCGCLKKLKWKYKCDASASGVSAHHEWTKSGSGCGEAAVFKLFQQLGAPGHCNCQSGSIPLGTCQLPYSACFYFASQDAMKAGQTLFKATVSGGGASATVSGQAGGQEAIAAAAQQLIAQHPEIMAQCGAAMLTHEGLSLLPVPDYSAPVDFEQIEGTEDVLLQGASDFIEQLQQE